MNILPLAPVALFTYNRPKHTKMILDSLSMNAESRNSIVYIFCDGIKENASSKDVKNIYRTREVVQEYSGFLSKEVIFRPHNYGLAENIIQGVDYVINKHKNIIVLEDDLIAAPGFLKYMNEALRMYNNEERVGCIHAWNYPLDSKMISDETFFLPGADCWGWGTWERAWKLYQPNGKVLLSKIKENGLSHNFNRRNMVNYVEMLEDQLSGKINSWAILWHASLFLAGMFCLHPVKSLVKNIGLDGSGTHSGNTKLSQNLSDFIELRKIPIMESEWFYKSYKKYLLFTKIEHIRHSLWNHGKRYLRKHYRQ